MKGNLPDAVLNRPKTPARSWQDPIVRTYFRGWKPSKDLSQFVDAKHLPSEFTAKTPSADFYPLFLDLWLQESQEKIKSMRASVMKLQKKG